MRNLHWLPRPLAVVVCVVFAHPMFAGAMEHPLPSGSNHAASSFEESWPQWRGPGRDGHALSTGLIREIPDEGPPVLWTNEGAGSGYASLTIAGGLMYTSGNRDGGQAISAFDLENGDERWSTVVTDSVPEHGYQGSRTTPTYDEGRLYVVSSDGKIVCLSAEDGDLIWSRDFSEWQGRMMSGWGYSESPLVDGPWVICTPGGPEAGLIALDKLSGDEIWRSKIEEFGDGRNRVDEELRPGAGYSSVVVSHGAGVKQYVQILGSGVVGVRAEDGEFLWGYEDVVNRVANIPTPIIVDDFVFCSTGYGTGSALLELRADGDGVSAHEAYFLGHRQLQNHHGGLIYVDGYIYGGHGHGEGFPICVEMESGEIAWGGDQRGPGRGSAAVTYVDGMLIFRYQNGVVALIDANPDSYRLLGEFRPEYQEGQSWAHPVVVDGRLYLREQNVLMCYDLRRATR